MESDSTPIAAVHPIRAARLKKKLSQESLGKQVGVEKASVSAWENGRKFPEPHTAIKVADVLSIKLEDVYASAA